MKKSLLASCLVAFCASTTFASVSTPATNEGMLGKVTETATMLKDATVEKIENLKTITKNLVSSDDNFDGVKKALKTLEIPEEVAVIKKSELGSLVEVTLQEGSGTLYFNTAGTDFIAGQHMKIIDGKVVPVQQLRAFEKLEEVAKDAVVYKAPNEKHVVSVFFDPTCHYCKKLYEGLDSYLEKGITVRFLGFPREGVDSKLATQMEAVFTSANPAQALKDMEAGKYPSEMKEPNIVKKHYQYGNEYGVRGTPAIILPTGDLVPGYLPADRLLDAIEKAIAEKAGK